MLKQPNFFYSQPSTLPKDSPAKFYLSTTVGFSFMISSVAPTRSSTFYAYLITKIGNRNLKIRKYAFFPISPILKSDPPKNGTSYLIKNYISKISKNRAIFSPCFRNVTFSNKNFTSTWKWAFLCKNHCQF